MAILSDDISINTMVGHGSLISGNLKIDGFVRIDGNIDGNLETTGKIIIGDDAKIRGNVTASSVISGGIVEGDVVAPEFVQLFSSAIVRGDVISKKITAEQNSIIDGYCISIKDDEKFEKMKNQWFDKRSITDKNIFGKKTNG